MKIRDEERMPVYAVEAGQAFAATNPKEGERRALPEKDLSLYVRNGEMCVENTAPTDRDEGGDGQCRGCSGFGCWNCGFSGGY